MRHTNVRVSCMLAIFPHRPHHHLLVHWVHLHRVVLQVSASGVCVCVCVCVCHPKWRVEDHVLAEEAKESGCFVWSRLVASAERGLRRLMEPQIACRGFSPTRSTATRVGVFALLNHLPTAPPGPGLAAEWEANYG